MTDEESLAESCSEAMKTNDVVVPFRGNSHQISGQVIPTGESE